MNEAKIGRFEDEKALILTRFDILSAAPHEAGGNLSLKDVRMAMSVGQKRHYRMDQIQPRHFEKRAHCAGTPEHTRQTDYVNLVNKGAGVLEQIGDALSADSPDRVATPIIECV